MWARGKTVYEDVYVCTHAQFITERVHCKGIREVDSRKEPSTQVDAPRVSVFFGNKRFLIN